MDLKTIERGAMTSTDVLAFLAGERCYGVPELTTTAIFEQPIPAGFQPMMQELRGRLKLLALPTGTSRGDIYKAYSHDITLINQCRDDFQIFINSAVQASIVRNEQRAITVNNQVLTIWGFVEKHMPAMALVPLIDLTAEIAAQPEDELLAHLKHEADQAITRLFKTVCLWLDALSTREFIGLVKFAGADAARYHYFRPLRTEKMLEENDGVTRQVGYDASKPFGQRTQYETKSGKLVEIKHDLERHDHDIVFTRVDTVADYPAPMPNRVVQFLNETPDFIRRHLRVVSGTIVRESVLRRTVATQVEDTRVVSTSLGSPAITIGDYYVPVGWSDRDMIKGATGYFKEQRAYPPFYRRIKWKKLLRLPPWKLTFGLIGAALVLSFVVWLFSLVVAHERQSGVYKEFGAQHVSAPLDVTLTRIVNFHPQTTNTRMIIVRLERDVKITFPRGEHFTLTGTNRSNFWVTVDPKSNVDAYRHAALQAPNSSAEAYFGSVDLGPVLGYPITLHILNVTQRSIEFTYKYNH